jgi:hypothetical protein
MSQYIEGIIGATAVGGRRVGRMKDMLAWRQLAYTVLLIHVIGSSVTVRQFFVLDRRFHEVQEQQAAIDWELLTGLYFPRGVPNYLAAQIRHR